ARSRRRRRGRRGRGTAASPRQWLARWTGPRSIRAWRTSSLVLHGDREGEAPAEPSGASGSAGASPSRLVLFGGVERNRGAEGVSNPQLEHPVLCERLGLVVLTHF